MQIMECGYTFDESIEETISDIFLWYSRKSVCFTTFCLIRKRFLNLLVLYRNVESKRRKRKMNLMTLKITRKKTIETLVYDSHESKKYRMNGATNESSIVKLFKWIRQFIICLIIT